VGHGAADRSRDDSSAGLLLVVARVIRGRRGPDGCMEGIMDARIVADQVFDSKFPTMAALRLRFCSSADGGAPALYITCADDEDGTLQVTADREDPRAVFLLRKHTDQRVSLISSLTQRAVSPANDGTSDDIDQHTWCLRPEIGEWEKLVAHRGSQPGTVALQCGDSHGNNSQPYWLEPAFLSPQNMEDGQLIVRRGNGGSAPGEWELLIPELACALSGPEPEPTSEPTGEWSSLEAALGVWYPALKQVLDELGATEEADLQELEPADIDALASKLKKLPAARFRKYIAALQGIDDTGGAKKIGAITGAELPAVRGAINEPGHWDAMISYTQRNGTAETLAVKISSELHKRGMSVWLDVEMDRRDEAAMEEGVKNSNCLIAIVSGPAGHDMAYFKRPFCLRELRWAKYAEISIVPVVSAEDKRYITEFFADIPADLEYLKSVNWEHIDRADKDYFALGVTKIVEAAGLC
jgi:hypothetical protein